MCSENNIKALAQLLLGCDWFRYQIELRKKDIELAKEEREFQIYAVDTNVPSFYINYQKDITLDFSNLLRSPFNFEKRYIQEALSYLNTYIGTYIFWQLSTDGVLMFPSVKKEFLKAALKWTKSYSNTEFNDIKKKINTEFNNIKEEIKEKESYTETEKGLKKDYKFHRFIRLLFLLKSQRLVNAIGTKIISKSKQEKVLDFRSFEELRDFNKNIEKWFKDIIETYKSEKKKLAVIPILNDAENMALLEYFNEILPEGYRIIYITTDIALMATATCREYYQQKKGRIFNNFTEAYIRHPLSFLADPQAWPSLEENSLYSHFNDLLPPVVDQNISKKDIFIFYRQYAPTQKHCDKAKEIYLQEGENDTYLENFFRNWKNLWQETEDTALIQQHIQRLKLEGKKIKEEFEDKNLAKKLLKIMIEPMNKILKNIGETFDWPLLKQRLKEGHRFPRGLPPLKFGKNSIVRANYIKLLSRPEQLANNLMQQNTKEEIESLINEDKTLYTFCLYTGVALCVFNYLERAHIFARQAVLIGDKEKNNNKTKINGREAYYLSSYLLRLLINKYEDLDIVEKFLKKAVKRYLEEQKQLELNFKGDFEDYNSLNDLRFVSLYLSTEISRFMFRRYLSSKLPKDFNKKSSLEEDLNKLIENLQNTLEKIKEQKEERPTVKKEYEFRIIEGDILCNLLVLKIEKYILEKERKNIDEVNQYIELLRENLWPTEKGFEKIREIPKSKYIEFILKLSEKLFLSNHKKNQHNELETMLSNINIKEFYVFPYDEARFEAYKDLIKKLNINQEDSW